jgi:RNA polymerase sigma-70 factor (ECF subfamily)
VTALERETTVRSVRGWLSRVIRSRAVDRRRSDSARGAREQAVRRRDVVPATDELVARADLQSFIAQAVTELPEPYRTTVLLRWFEDLSPSEIAARTATSPETVKTRLRRAHALLRERLDAEFGEGRRHWRAVLVPWLAPFPVPSPRTGPASPIAATLTLGGAAVTMKSKLALVALAVVLLCAVVGSVATTLPNDTDAQRDAASALSGSTRTQGADARSHGEARRTSIVGIVRRRLDGRPVPHVEVRVTPARGPSLCASTDRDGAFRLDDATGKVWTLAVDAGRGFSAMKSELTAGDSAVADAGTLWLEDDARPLIRVVDGDDAPVAGAEVRAFRLRNPGFLGHVDSYLLDQVVPSRAVDLERRARTDVEGLAVLDDAGPGWWRIAARSARGATNEAFASFAPDAPQRIVTLHLAPAHTLTGTLLDVNGSAVARARRDRRHGVEPGEHDGHRGALPARRTRGGRPRSARGPGRRSGRAVRRRARPRRARRDAHTARVRAHRGARPRRVRRHAQRCVGGGRSDRLRADARLGAQRNERHVRLREHSRGSVDARAIAPRWRGTCVAAHPRRRADRTERRRHDQSSRAGDRR